MTRALDLDGLADRVEKALDIATRYSGGIHFGETSDGELSFADLRLLIAAARERDGLRERLEEALRWLEWARPKALIAIDDHRMARVKAGHEMTGKYRSGTTYVGIYQDEVDEIEASGDFISEARHALTNKPDGASA